VTQKTLDLDGHDCGPLFAPVCKRRAPKPHNGPERRDLVNSRVPQWADRLAIRAFFDAARLMTRNTGTQYSVDHIVPVNHPLVCGLHVEHNLEVTTLLANLMKSNNYWPDMWGQQPELF
jgi:hypothetical protein